MPLVIVLVIVIAVIVGARLMGRRGASGQSQQPAQSQSRGQDRDLDASGSKDSGKRSRNEITREDAQEASAKLSPEAHRKVYALIAQHQVLNAVKEYRKATKTGLGVAASAVAALAQFPQPTPERPAATSAVELPNSTSASDTPTAARPEPTTQPEPSAHPSIKDGPLTVDDIIGAASAATTPVTPVTPGTPAAPATAATPAVAATGSYRYRAIVSQGNEIREVASTRLNADIYGQIRQLALSGNLDKAARLLRDHSDVGEAQAREFVAMIGPEE